MKNKIGITPAAFQAAMEGNFDNFVAAITPGGIEAQEAAGQRKLVNSNMLPKEIIDGGTREQLENMGIIFKDDVDDIFVNVVLPEGWKKVPTDHSMWSDLKDDKGRRRAKIFYKVAFYDRNAHMFLEKRFSVSVLPKDRYLTDMSTEERMKGEYYGFVFDGNEVIYRTKPVTGYDYEEHQKLRKEAEEWIMKKYPKYEDPTAYWED